MMADREVISGNRSSQLHIHRQTAATDQPGLLEPSGVALFGSPAFLLQSGHRPRRLKELETVFCLDGISITGWV
jgi:hypothetical protein